MENLSEEPSPASVDASPACGPIGVGSVVAGRYELTRLLGRGSMGEVWAANHRGLGETVALKLLTQAPPFSFRLESQSTSAARFRFEAKLAARLSRKTRNIVRVSDYGEEDGVTYLVMELLEGETLEARLLRGPLPAVPAIALVSQIARALEEAHADGVVHRDLKPANVFLACDEEGALLVKLLDFGIARMIRADSSAPPATAHGLWCGTPGYLSPEQARMEKLDTRCDLWALATVAYEALTGDLPVAGTTAEELIANLHARLFVSLHQRMPQLGSDLAPFFERAFAERIEDRFSTASELATAFERAVDSEPFVEASSTTVAVTAALRPRPARSGWPSLARGVFRRACGARAVMAMIGAVTGLLTFAVAKAAWGPTGASVSAASAMTSAPVMATPPSAASDSTGLTERDNGIGIHQAPSPAPASRKTQVAAVPSVGLHVSVGSPPPRPPSDGTPAPAAAKSAKGPADRSSFF